MKNILIGILVSLVIISCSSNSNKTEGADTIIAGNTLAKATSTKPTDSTATVTSLCFLHTDGNKNQDSTSVELVVRGSQVTGLMNWMPYQKDSRKGKLKGTIKGDSIQAIWTYMQEGIADTMSVQFKLKDDQLMQKPFKLNSKTGREQINAAAGYTTLYTSSNKINN